MKTACLLILLFIPPVFGQEKKEPLWLAANAKSIAVAFYYFPKERKFESGDHKPITKERALLLARFADGLWGTNYACWVENVIKRDGVK